MTRLPNVFILGAQKAGTTWLASSMERHPEIALGRTKEAHCFDRPEHAADPEPFYADHFSESDAPLLLDGTPNYLCDPDAPALIAKHCPDANFIVSLRHPVDRVRSALAHYVATSRLPVGVDQTDYLHRLLAGEPDHWKVLAFSDYATGLRRWLDHVPLDRFCFLVFEDDIATDPLIGLTQALGHLGLGTDTLEPGQTAVSNASPRRRSTMRLARHVRGGKRLAHSIERLLPDVPLEPLPAEEPLADRFRDDIAYLEKVTGRSLATWNL